MFQTITELHVGNKKTSGETIGYICLMGKVTDTRPYTILKKWQTLEYIPETTYFYAFIRMADISIMRFPIKLPPCMGFLPSSVNSCTSNDRTKTTYAYFYISNQPVVTDPEKTL